MQTPLEITFRGMTPSPAVEAAVARWVTRLEHDHARILRCSVLVELPHQHHRQGNPFHVRIDLKVPGTEISVSHDPGNEDVYIAVADAFRSARRQLHDHVTTVRGDRERNAPRD